MSRISSMNEIAFGSREDVLFEITINGKKWPRCLRNFHLAAQLLYGLDPISDVEHAPLNRRFLLLVPREPLCDAPEQHLATSRDSTPWSWIRVRWLDCIRFLLRDIKRGSAATKLGIRTIECVEVEFHCAESFRLWLLWLWVGKGSRKFSAFQHGWMGTGISRSGGKTFVGGEGARQTSLSGWVGRRNRGSANVAPRTVLQRTWSVV